jgi:hypothetical protein
MLSQRQRPVVWALAGIAGIWILATAGYIIARNAKVTAEKVQAYVADVNLTKLSVADRAEALSKLAAMLNALSLEDRRRLRLGGSVEGWFTQMTEEEKASFIEATMPTGFKQMIAAFEEQPEEKRRRTIDESLKRLREANAQALPGGATGGREGTNRGSTLSPELEAKVRPIGLKSFYSQSSAQTKAELAPLLEEMQKAMESGRMMRAR